MNRLRSIALTAALVTTLLFASSTIAPQHAQAAPAHQPQLKPGVARNVAGFMNFLKILQDLAGSVKGFAKGAAQGVAGGAGELIRIALDGLLLKGVPDPNIRSILSTAIGSIGSQLSKPGFSLTNAVIAVLRALANDPALGELVASTIEIVELRPVIKRGLKAVFTSLASATGVRSVMSNPMGFLTGVAVKLINDTKGQVADLLLTYAKVEPANRASVKTNLLGAIDVLKTAIARKSFSELLNFGKAIAVLVTQALYGEFVKLLKHNAPAAKKKLRELVGKLPLPAQIKGIADGVVNGIGAGGSKFVDDAAMCGNVITAISAESARALFQCLKLALRSGVGAGKEGATAAPAEAAADAPEENEATPASAEEPATEAPAAEAAGDAPPEEAPAAEEGEAEAPAEQ